MMKSKVSGGEVGLSKGKQSRSMDFVDTGTVEPKRSNQMSSRAHVPPCAAMPKSGHGLGLSMWPSGRRCRCPSEPDDGCARDEHCTAAGAAGAKPGYLLRQACHENVVAVVGKEAAVVVDVSPAPPWRRVRRETMLATTAVFDLKPTQQPVTSQAGNHVSPRSLV